MFINDFYNKFASLYGNHAPVHSLRIIFTMITEGLVVSDEDFEEWFSAAIEFMGLEKGVHYRYRGEGIDTVYVKGCVGIAMLMGADNEIGEFTRNYLQELHQHTCDLQCQVDSTPAAEDEMPPTITQAE
jgi:hypothetical protein